MKKEWSKPEVSSLGVQNTAEEISAFGVDPTYPGSVQCGWCLVTFKDVASYEAHKTRRVGSAGSECVKAPDNGNRVDDAAIFLS